MPLTNTSLSAPNINAAILLFADFADLPIRGAYAPMPITVPVGLADADADCAGFTFPTIDSEVLQLGRVSHADGGTDTLAFTLHADAADPALLTAIENPALYLGRQVRVWLALHDGAGTATELRPLYRGYMTTPAQQSNGQNFVITMEAENYASLLANAQMRTYLNSKKYDPGDLSDEASKALPPGQIIIPGGGRPFNEIRPREQ